MLAILLLLVVLYVALQSATVQTWLVKKVANNLSQKLHTKVTIKSIDVRFFNKLLLQGLMVEDLKKDTLLYAGTAKANVNDWFFFKDKISIENIGLDDAVVNMKRTDSVWNYQFLADYFSSPKSNKKDTTAAIDIDFKEIHLSNIKFNKIDRWIGQDMMVNLSNIDVLVDVLDLKNKNIHVKEIKINKPFFSQNDYEGNRPPRQDLQQVIEKIPVLGAFKWNNSGWQFRLDNLAINEGSFKNDKFTKTAPFTDRFDGQHLYFSGITGQLKNLLFLRDTLAVQVDLHAKEKSGLLIKNLQSNLKLTPELMEFNQLNLETNNSQLRDYYAMKFESFGEDFSRFLHSVTLEAHFKNSKLSSDDLAFFAPALKTWKRLFYLEGNAKGPLDNFSARDMKISSGNSFIEGNIAMRGLPDITTTFIDFQAKDLRTNYADLVSVAPTIKNLTKPAIAKLGTIGFKGNFTGFIKDFVAFGTFNTALGSIIADVNMKVPENAPPAYSGSIATAGFNLGSFLENPILGNVVLNLKIVGKGFNINDLKTNVNGTVANIKVDKYNYKNLVINGDFTKKLFSGHASINDDNLKISSFDGSVNLFDKNPFFKLKASIEKADLQRLTLTQQPFLFSGNVDVNFTGNTVDNFLGIAKISNAKLLQNGNQLSFDSLTIDSKIIDNQKSLSISSNEVDANITGIFKIADIPNAITLLLSKYYPTYINAPKNTVKSIQNFTFNIKTNNVSQYINLIDKKLGGFNNANITGSFNLQNNQIALTATVPQFSYDKKIFTNTVFDGVGTRDTLNATVAVDDIVINDSLHLPNTKISLAANNDLSFIKLNTSASKIFGDAELNASIQTLSDGVKIHFFPSSFVINNKKWELNKDGELTLRRRFIDASEVKFFHENQEIVLSTELSTENESTNLIATLKNIDLIDLAFILPPNPTLKGIVSGKAEASDIFGNTKINFTGYADSIALNDKYMGKINLLANANTTTGNIAYSIDTDEKDFKFAVDGLYNYKDSSGKSLAINVQAQKLDLSILQPYLKTIFSDIGGIANGNMAINSNGKNLTIVGDATINKGSFKVGYTQVRYNFDNQTIRFGKDVMDLGTLQITDTLGNKGTVSGKMYHQFFQNFNFENMRFSSPKILLLNTTKKDNAQFYGRVIGRGNMALDGDIANMKMNIDGEPSPTDTSHIYLPTGNSKESNAIDYIDFIQFGSLMDNDAGIKDLANLVVNLDLTANPACKIDVILNEETGDIIKGQGNGVLNIRVGTKEPLSIRGRYDLTQGEYTFNFQTILNRPFTLSRGSIVWNGDPFLANIDMDAAYLAKNVDLSTINSNGNRQQEDMLIQSHITGTLKLPVIGFEFKLPENSELNRDFYLVKRLAEYKNDENEMNKQVASLLLFNQFINNSQAFITGESTLSIATGTIGGVVSAWLTSILSRALEKATKGVVSAYVDVNPSLNFAQANQLQANIRSRLKFKITQNLQFLVGGNLDYNNPLTQIYSRGGITPDLSLEWLINKDGSLRVVAFNRTSVDFTTGQRNRTGLQLGYKREVNRVTDIFRSKKKIAELDALKLQKTNGAKVSIQ